MKSSVLLKTSYVRFCIELIFDTFTLLNEIYRVNVSGHQNKTGIGPIESAAFGYYTWGHISPPLPHFTWRDWQGGLCRV